MSARNGFASGGDCVEHGFWLRGRNRSRRVISTCYLDERKTKTAPGAHRELERQRKAAMRERRAVCRRSSSGNAEEVTRSLERKRPRTDPRSQAVKSDGGQAKRSTRLYHPNPRKAKLIVTIATKYLLDVRSVAYVDYVKTDNGHHRRSKTERREARSVGISKHGFPLPRSQRSNPRALGDNPRRVAHRASR